MGKASSAKKVARPAGPAARRPRAQARSWATRSARRHRGRRCPDGALRPPDTRSAAVCPSGRRALARRVRHLRLRRVPARHHRDGEDTTGIHTHGDGVIHIHPFARRGRKQRHARRAARPPVSSSRHRVHRDGTTYDDGFDCNGNPAPCRCTHGRRELAAEPDLHRRRHQQLDSARTGRHHPRRRAPGTEAPRTAGVPAARPARRRPRADLHDHHGRGTAATAATDTAAAATTPRQRAPMKAVVLVGGFGPACGP